MDKHENRAGNRFASRGSPFEGEALLALAAAGVTAAVWLSLAGWAMPGAQPPAVARSGEAKAMRYVSLPTVVIVGHRESAQPTPVATTAQNTAANPVTLHQ